MTIHETMLAALQVALPNTWAIELPPEPAWPAAVFDVQSTPEEGWCVGGGYTQHEVTVIALARTVGELDVLLPHDAPGGSIRAALEGIAGYMFEESCEDADYEPDPSVFGRAITVRIRTPRY